MSKKAIDIDVKVLEFFFDFLDMTKKEENEKFLDMIKNWTRLKNQHEKFRNFLDMTERRFWTRLKKRS